MTLPHTLNPSAAAAARSVIAAHALECVATWDDHGTTLANIAADVDRIRTTARAVDDAAAGAELDDEHALTLVRMADDNVGFFDEFDRDLAEHERELRARSVQLIETLAA